MPAGPLPHVGLKNGRLRTASHDERGTDDSCRIYLQTRNCMKFRSDSMGSASPGVKVTGNPEATLRTYSAEIITAGNGVSVPRNQGTQCRKAS